MRKFTLFIASLCLTIGAIAQTATNYSKIPVLELSGETIGSTYPYKLTDDDAAKVFEIENGTVIIDVIIPNALSDQHRDVLVCASDPNQPTATAATPSNSPYMAIGLYNDGMGYFASSRIADRFTKACTKNRQNTYARLVYVFDKENGKFRMYINGKTMNNIDLPVTLNSGVTYEHCTFSDLKSDYPDANIYIGGGVTSNGDIEVFDGKICNVKFYDEALSEEYIKNICGNYYTLKTSDYYLTTNNTNITSSASTGDIFYINKDNVLSYNSGRYITSGTHTAVGSTPSTTYFRKDISDNPNKVNIYIGGKFIQIDKNGNPGYYSRTNVNTNVPDTDLAKWTIEPVTTLPVTITAVGYATWYAPVAVELPEGVTAHTVTINGNWATLSEGFNQVPANTGVILAGNEGNYDLTIIDSAPTVVSNLEGSVNASLVSKDAYVLSSENNVAGLYKAMKNYDATGNKQETEQTNGSFLNNSHKAYLPATAVSTTAQGSNGFRFSLGDTTAIEEVEAENENADVIYDLQGRRVNEITEAGIYIVNGNKVLIK